MLPILLWRQRHSAEGLLISRPVMDRRQTGGDHEIPATQSQEITGGWAAVKLASALCSGSGSGGGIGGSSGGGSTSNR